MDPRSQSNYKGAMMDCKKCVTHNGRSLVDHECFRDFPNPELVSSSEKTMSLFIMCYKNEGYGFESLYEKFQCVSSTEEQGIPVLQ